MASWYTLGMDMTITMPYLATISVNTAYRRGSPRYGKKKVVTEWLADFRLLIQNQLQLLDYREVPERVRVDVRVFCPRRCGRLPDTENMVKLPTDVLASVIGLDDAHFTITSHSAARSDDPCIVFTVQLEP